MPIYVYKCSACGHLEDVLQKMSDPRLTVCPQCGESTYTKQVTAAGFQLKGSGWYVTDFRDNGAKPAPTSPQAAADSGSSGPSSPAGDAAPATAASGGAEKPAAAANQASAVKGGSSTSSTASSTN